MEQCYNWENNILKFKDKNNNEYLLDFKDSKTIVHGKSATGKSLMCNMLSYFVNDTNIGLKPYNTDNIFIVSKDNIDKVINQKNKLIIIDRAEILLNEQLVEFINQDRINRYLIFLRKPMGLAVSPNYFATLYNDNGCIKLRYDFDIVGWN